MDAVPQSLDHFPPPSDERRFPRRPVLFARVEFGENAEAGIVVNVSEGGLCVQSAREIVGDWPLPLRIHCLPSGWIEATGRPVWQDEARTVTGIEFVDLSEKARREISKWLTFGTSLQRLHGNWSIEGSRKGRVAPVDSVAHDANATEEYPASLLQDMTNERAESREAPYLGGGAFVSAERRKHFRVHGRGSRIVISGIILMLALAALWTERNDRFVRRVERTFVKSSEAQKSASSSASQLPVTKAPPEAAPVQQSPPAENFLLSKSSPVASVSTTNNAMVLQVAAMGLAENANALAESLRRKNFPAFAWWRPGDRFYRVLVGPYGDGASVASAKDALKKEGVSAIEKHWSSKQEQSPK